MSSKKNERELADKCILDFYTFFRCFWHVINEDKLTDNWHLHFLCKKMQRYGEQVVKQEPALPDGIFNVCPGSTKSTIISQMFNAWVWLHAPWVCVISATYSYELARFHHSKTKEIINSLQYQNWYQSYFEKRFGKRLLWSKNTERESVNNFGGFRLVIGTDTGVLGRHAHIILIDDAMDSKRVHSKVYRDKVNNRSIKGLSSRKKNSITCPTILLMQKLHADDTTSYMLAKAQEKSKPIDHVLIPAELSDNVNPEYLKKYYKNGLFNPRRTTHQVLEEQKIELGRYGYANEYQQLSSPEDGGKVLRTWWQYIDRDDLPEGLIWHKMIDGAYTDNTQNDPSGIMTYAFDENKNRLYIFKWEARHMELPDMVKHLKQSWTWSSWSPRSKHYFEPKATGHSLQQYIKEDVDQTAILLKDTMVGGLIRGGKEARLQRASPKIESGQIILVRDYWNDDFIQEICGFPNESHDEAVDCLGYAVGLHFKSRKRKGARHRQ